MQHVNIELGPKLRQIRKRHSESITQASQLMDVDRSHLNKIELGQLKPSASLLEKILAHYSVEGEEAHMIRQLASTEPMQLRVIEERKEVNMVTHSNNAIEAPQQAQVSVDPARTPVMYTDSTFVNSSEFGLVLDVAQTLGGQQHNVVARIGMSFDHAKKLIEVMQDHIAKNER